MSPVTFDFAAEAAKHLVCDVSFVHRLAVGSNESPYAYYVTNIIGLPVPPAVSYGAFHVIICFIIL